MKKTLFTIVILLISINIVAQKEDISDGRINEIGLSVSDLLNGSYLFEYERMVGNHISLSLGVGYKGDNGLIRLSGLDTDKIQTGDLTYSGFKFIPAICYYLDKTTRYSMDGFYFGAYLKYSNYKSELVGTYINESNDSYSVEFDGQFSVTSFGFMVGYKIPINERFSVNFLIVGPGVGFHNFELTQKKDLPDEFFDDLNEALDQYSIFDLLNGDFKFSPSDAKTDFVSASLRYGITIGYSF